MKEEKRKEKSVATRVSDLQPLGALVPKHYKRNSWLAGLHRTWHLLIQPFDSVEVDTSKVSVQFDTPAGGSYRCF